MLPRRWILAATACVVGGGLAAAGWQRLRSHRRTVDPSEGLKPTDWSAPLFSGTLDEWLPYSGEWQSTNDEEGARVIAGKQGIIRRELLRDDQPLNFYRLSLAVKLHQASAVEVQFGVEAAEQLDAPRIVVRLTSDTVEIAERLSDSGTPQTEIQSDLEPWGADRFRSIRIERLRQNWRVLVNGRELGGMAPGLVRRRGGPGTAVRRAAIRRIRRPARRRRENETAWRATNRYVTSRPRS
jgi:hypothetical protein